ncbi:Retrovirus-related Pol polyprotein from transposon 17.6, partial [Mucuna pruriens]
MACHAIRMTNTPSTFMRLINHVLRSLIGKCVIVYFDDILIYSTCLNYHLLHFKSMLEVTRKETFYANLDKCTFCTHEVVFLGYVVCSHGVKVKSIQEWPTPKTVREVMCFHGLSSFYKRFIRDFSTLAAPLNEIIKKLEESQERSFQALKDNLTYAPILALPNFAKSFELECDTSNVGIGFFCYKKGTPLHTLVKSLKVSTLIFPPMIKSSMLLWGALHVWQHYLLNKDNCVRMILILVKHMPCVYIRPMVAIFSMMTFYLKKGDCVCLEALLETCLERGTLGNLRLYEILFEHFFWLYMRKGIYHVCERCLVCKMTKSKVLPHGLCTPSPYSTTPWVDISMNFI